MKRKLLLLTIAFLTILHANAQRAQGSWQDYLSYSNTFKVALSQDKVFCATKGGLLYYDIDDNSVNKFSAIAELSDFGIATIAYSNENNVLVIAYNNGNIDLVYGSQVVNVSDIKRKDISGDKTINNISFIGSEAYFSCGFGIVVMNLEKMEIKDTYYIGSSGSATEVNDVAKYGDYLYAATNRGIQKADMILGNLQDYHNWEDVREIPNFRGKFNHLVVHNGKLVANYTPDEQYSDEMYAFDGNSWEKYLPIGYARDMQTNGNYLTIASRDKIFIVDNNHQIAFEIDSYKLPQETFTSIRPMSAAIHNDGTIWAADNTKSLVKITGGNAESGFLTGPLDNTIFSLNFSGSALWIAPGGTGGWEFPRFQRYEDNQWVYFNGDNHPELAAEDDFRNIVEIEVDPKDPSHVFVASWGGGLLEYKNDEFVKRYTNLNSPLETALPQQPELPYVRIGGLDFDSDGNLWITNSESSYVLKKLSPQGEWKSFELPEIAGNKTLGPVIVTQRGDKWVVASRGDGAYVVDKTGDDKKRLLVKSYFNNGEKELIKSMNDILSIAEDNEGAIWLGTTEGVAVYTNPNRVWTSDNFFAIQPSLDLNDGIYHPLLETESVTAIAIDGANRKWLGTEGSGVYLVSENGDEELMHFTAENSPLLSNTITSIAINPENGEIFFGTTEGLISYLGEAIGGKDSYANVYVYPNPVRETYDGPVTVTGLKENTEVKITDVSGNLVFRTKSLGGQAIWDGRNLNGNRVKTGVYLVMCNDELGEETHISKLLFIH